LLPPGGKFVCQVQQEVSQPELDAADVYAAYTVSVGVSGVATPLGNNSSEVTSGDAEAVALAPAIMHGLSIDATSASPTIVTDAGNGRQNCVVLISPRERCWQGAVYFVHFLDSVLVEQLFTQRDMEYSASMPSMFNIP
jgi:hypothetical protein